MTFSQIMWRDWGSWFQTSRLQNQTDGSIGRESGLFSKRLGHLHLSGSLLVSCGSLRRDTTSSQCANQTLSPARFEKTLMKLYFFGPFHRKPSQDIIALLAALALLLHDCLVLAYMKDFYTDPLIWIYKKVIKTEVTLLPQFRCYIQKISKLQNTENYHFFINSEKICFILFKWRVH